MSTFIGQLIGFAVIVWLLGKYVVPPVRTMMKNQQDAVRQALDESAAAAKKLASADDEHTKALEDAKNEAVKVTDEARTESTRIAEQLRQQAGTEAERIKAQGAQQVHLLRQQTVRELRAGLGAQSVQRAEEIVRAHVADESAQSATVDRFLDELDAMSPSAAVFELGATLNLRAASRDALAEVVKKFDSATDGLDETALSGLATDLTGTARLLSDQPALNKLLAKPVEDPAAKVSLVRNLFEGKVGVPALDVLSAAVSQRWSEESNLGESIEHVARLALLARADSSGAGEQVEEQLFRVSRVLDANPRLSLLLSDTSTPVEGRIGLLDNVLDGAGTAPATADLLRQTVELLRGERADEAVLELAELAVARRGEVVAHVTAAGELSDEQTRRLTEILSRIYGHPVAVQFNVDPELMGGLLITVGDEVIDGAISSRLAAARAGLPD